MRPIIRLRKPMLYPWRYEGILELSRHSLWSFCLQSTTPAQDVETYYSLRATTPHYSST